MIRLVKTCESCGTKTTIEIDIEKRLVKISSLFGGVNTKAFGVSNECPSVAYRIMKPDCVDPLIFAATMNGYLVE